MTAILFRFDLVLLWFYWFWNWLNWSRRNRSNPKCVFPKSGSRSKVFWKGWLLPCLLWTRSRSRSRVLLEGCLLFSRSRSVPCSFTPVCGSASVPDCDIYSKYFCVTYYCLFFLGVSRFEREISVSWSSHCPLSTLINVSFTSKISLFYSITASLVIGVSFPEEFLSVTFCRNFGGEKCPIRQFGAACDLIGRFESETVVWISSLSTFFKPFSFVEET